MINLDSSCEICKVKHASLERLQTHLNRDHSNKINRNFHTLQFTQCSRCFKYCRKGAGLSIHRTRFCKGPLLPTEDQETSSIDSTSDPGFDPNTLENFPIPLPKLTTETLEDLLFQKHITIRHLKPKMATTLSRLCEPLLGAIVQANENNNENRANEATCAFLLAPILTKTFSSPISLNREIDILLESPNIAKAALELAYRSIHNGNLQPTTPAGGERSTLAVKTTVAGAINTRDKNNTTVGECSTSTSSSSSNTTSILTPAVQRRRSSRIMSGPITDQQRETPTFLTTYGSISGGGGTGATAASATGVAPPAASSILIIPRHTGTTADQQRFTPRTFSTDSISGRGGSARPASTIVTGPGRATVSTAIHQQQTAAEQEQRQENLLSPFLAKKVTAHVRANQLSKAIEILETSILGASPIKDSFLTEENIVEFQALHPTGDGFNFIPGNADDPIEITRKDISNAIFGSKKEISSAFSPWSNELIRIMWGFENFKSRLLCIYNLMLSGNLLGKNFWITSRSILLKKANGKIRPIAIGDPFIRILSKIVAQKFKSMASEYFYPYQYANGISSGTEIVSHALQNFINSQTHDKTKVIIALDCKNAFNCIQRKHIYERLAATFPSFLHFFNWKYGSETALILSDGSKVGACSEGVHQGDPWASMLFTLGLHTVLQEFKVFQPHAFIFGFADDLNVATTADQVDDTINFLKPKLKAIGLTLSIEKCTTIVHPNCLHNISSTSTTSQGSTILGIPMGTKEYILNQLDTKLDEYTRILHMISRMDAQLAYPLLQSCVNARPMFLLRCIPPSLTSSFCNKFDMYMNRTIALIAGCPTETLELHSEVIRQLPTSWGGLGIRAMQNFNKDSYLASSLYSLTFLRNNHPEFWKAFPFFNDELINLHNGQASLDSPSIYQADTINDIIPVLGEEDHVKGSTVSQKSLYQARIFSIFNILIGIDEVPPAFKAWIMASQSPGCSAWLYSSVQISPQLKLSHTEFLEAFRLRLCLPIIEQDRIAPQVCKCDEIVLDEDRQEMHGLNCSSTAFPREKRHDHVVRLLVQFLNSVTPECSIIKFARVQSEEELNSGAPESPKKMSDFRLEFPSGKVYWVDVAIVNPAAPSYLALGSDKDGFLATSREEDRKSRIYEKFLPPGQTGRFIPFICSATGSLGRKATEFIEEIALMRKAVFNDVEVNKRIANKRRYTVRAISTAIMRWNASMLQTFRSQTTLRDDIPPGTDFFPPEQPTPSVHGRALSQPTIIRSPRPLPTSFQQRLNTAMAFEFLSNIPPESEE